ncbi:MAG TPA: alpha/beta hydrolase [Gammaproteobacteria bacterium]|nr:alpha/beta hydrolase [Gammaproteobacteria bacterium]
MKHEFMEWRGLRICVSEHGAGRPLFLVPGIGCSADMWAPFIDYFPSRHIISFDAPGAGRSSTPLCPVPMASLAALAAAVLDHRGVERTDVIGFSYGGAIAQQLAYDHPERVLKLVLAATNCGLGSHFGKPSAMVAMATPLRFYSAAYFETVAAAVYGGVTGRDAKKRSNAAAARRRAPPSSYGYAMQLLGGFGWSSWSFLPSIRHETLVVCGDDDPLVPLADARLLAARIPHARLEVVERAGHLLLWDEPERIAPRIGQFVGWG